MTMTKGVYDHGLTTFGFVALGQQFYQKSFLLFKNSFFHKEESDYRLYLIQLLPSLRTCDDRAIRDSERQMACAYFEQTHGAKSRER